MNTIYFRPDPVLGFRLGTSLGRHSFARFQNHYEENDVRGMMEAAGFRDLRFLPGRNLIGEFASAVGRK